jgi:dCMP deaminase
VDREKILEVHRTGRWDKRFLQLAKLVSGWSRDTSTQCGAVITDSRKRVLSIGFNGFPQGMDDNPALYADREQKYSRIVHAEMNALLFANAIPENASLYVYPLLPCDRCVVQLLQAGIRRFVSVECSPERAERWRDALDRSCRYINECGGKWIEYPESFIGS